MRRASFFRSDASANIASRTVRTEVTVERRQGVAVVTGHLVAGLDTCPLCGTKLAPEQMEQARLGLPRESISKESYSLDRAPPPVRGTG